MPLGRSVRIFLADGSVAGIRHGEIVNWTGQAIACPRARFAELRDWAEARKPGVYFLIGTDEESGQDAVYIGEAEVVLDRLGSHISGKDFWVELVAFTNKDDNLTKGHVRYLEARLVQQATIAERYVVKNAASPSLPSLPRADRDAMEEYIESTRILLGVLGHKVLEPILSQSTIPTPVLVNAPATDSTRSDLTTRPNDDSVAAPVDPTFRLNDSRLSAYARRTDEGLVVLEGAEAALAEQQSLSMGNKQLRARLIQSGTLTKVDGHLKFTRNHLFNSPSQAACIVLGYSANGRELWRLADGTTFGAYEARLLRQSAGAGTGGDG